MKQDELNKEQQALLELVTRTANLIMKKEGYHITIPESTVFIVLQAYGVVQGATKELQEEHGVQ